MSGSGPDAIFFKKMLFDFQHPMPTQEAVQFRFLRAFVC